MDRELISRSIDYILRHFDEDISVKDIAEHFHYSEYYFCRAFKAATGESVYEFIKRLKMDQSAVDIKLIKDRPITDIGLDYGYSSSNYSTAFKKHHNVSPAKFRKSTNVTGMASPFYEDGISGFDTFDGYADRIEIRELEDFSVIYERVIGNYIELKEKWPQFMDKYKEYIKEDTLFIERFYDDPTIAGLDSCIYDICMTADEFSAPDNRTAIEGGKYAVYRYDGKIEDIFCSVQGVFSVWLPNSGYVMDKRYGLNIYQKIDGSSEGITMDLCIPIK
jgi:AraC family transcriptional regulator